jgi:hypothetical protein
MEKAMSIELKVKPILQTRASSEIKINKNKYQFYIIEILNDFNISMTKEEIISEMIERDYVDYDNKNLVALSIAEMLNGGLLKCFAKNDKELFIVNNKAGGL